MATKQQIDTAISDLIAQYPTRWKQAVGNSALRGWFVTKAAKALGSDSAADRAAISYALDQAALSQSQDMDRGQR